MEPFKTITSLAAPLDRVNVDTDQIIPKQFLKRIERSGYGEFLFFDWSRIQEGPGVSKEQVGQPDELGHPAADAGGVGADRGPGPDLPGQVGDRAADILVPDIQAEDQARVGPDLVQPGRTAGHAGPLARDPDQARALDVVQGQRHRGLGQARDAGQLSPGAGTALADVLEQQLLVHRPDQRRARGEKDRASALGRRQSRGRPIGRDRLNGGRNRVRTSRQGCHGDLLHSLCEASGARHAAARWSRKLRPWVSSSGLLSPTDS